MFSESSEERVMFNRWRWVVSLSVFMKKGAAHQVMIISGPLFPLSLGTKTSVEIVLRTLPLEGIPSQQTPKGHFSAVRIP